MDVNEQIAKELLAARGLRIPRGIAVSTPEGAASAAGELGVAVVLKPLLRVGRRGKAGLIRFASDGAGARAEAEDLLAQAERLRVEERVAIHRELYAAVVTDRSSKCPVLLFSPEGGIEVENARELTRRPIDIRHGVTSSLLEAYPREVRGVLAILYRAYRDFDAELVEVNPLAIASGGDLVALDAKLVLDDSALFRHPELELEPPRGTALEERARAAGLYYVELDGNVGVLANGAGLTMATLDAVRYHGGRPANFMEIGGDAYRKAQEALEIVVGNPRAESLLVNLCGAYARTDVIIEGFLAGWEALRPEIPVTFSIHGTGEERAIHLVQGALGVEPFDSMDEAVRAAIPHD